MATASQLTACPFQPTRPLRGATSIASITSSGSSISTHAPLAGRDPARSRAFSGFGISTHAPLAGRDKKGYQYEGRHNTFQPTRPLRGATTKNDTRDSQNNISTHAPLAGRDSKSVQITMHIFAITDKFQMLLHRMPPVRAFCSFLMQESHADFGCEPPK